MSRPPSKLADRPGLRTAWAGQPQWRLLQAHFGDGSAFLAAWHAWREDAQRPRLLHVVALAAHAPSDVPLQASDDVTLQPLADELAAQCRGLTPGFHRFAFDDGRVLLTLCVGEPLAMLREQAFRADAVGVEGTESLDTCKALTRLCRRGAWLAVHAQAASSQRELQSCGWVFDGSDPLAARYEPDWPVRGLADEARVPPGDCVVVGAGLAGAAVAASLARRGWSVTVLDAARAPAAGASSLPAGLAAPHQSPDDNPLSRLSRAGLRLTLQQARQRLAQGLEWAPTGVLEWRGEDARALPLLGAALEPWSRAASEAQKRAAGIATDDTAWWHENAAWIEPAALVRSWLREPGVRFLGGARIGAIRRDGARWVLDDAEGRTITSAPLVVVAAAVASGPLLAGRITVQPVRGQLAWAPHGEEAQALPPFPVNGHGHFLPKVPLLERGAWMTGSTYGRGDADTDVRGEDTAANLQRARELLPKAQGAIDAAAARGELRAWSGVRCASMDRRPLLGEVEAGLWVSTAMGSRGLTFAALCGELLAARLHGEPLPVEARLAQALDVGRQG